MIPKIVHSVWFGRGKKAGVFEECVENQKKFCRDEGWEFRETDEDTLGAELMASPFVKAVLARGEWTKATVVGRYAALARHGGVYLDCDVEIVGSFDALLGLPFLAGWEDDHHVCDAVIGSVPASEPLGGTIEYLFNKLPLGTDGLLGAHEYGPGYLTRSLRYLCTADRMQPPEVFYPSHWGSPGDVRRTKRTVTVHRWAGSWVVKKERKKK